MAVVFDAVTTGATNWGVAASTHPSLTVSHTAAGGTDCIVIAHISWFISPDDMSIVSGRGCTYNSVAMTSLGYLLDANDNRHLQEAFYLYNPPSGARNVTCTATASSSRTWNTGIRTVSYKGASGTPTLASANVTSPASLGVSSATGHLISAAASIWQAPALTIGGTVHGSDLATGGYGVNLQDVTGSGSASVTASWTGSPGTIMAVDIPGAPYVQFFISRRG